VAYGYHSKILFIDLSRQLVKVLRFNEEFYKVYIGGRGVAAKFLIELVGRDVEAFSPDNALIIAAGPLTGTSIPMSSRLHFAFKSPVTHAWGESSMGGSFPYFFKHSGIDALIIKGRSKKPVYIHVEDGNAEIKNAEAFWGLDTYEAEKALIEEAGGKSIARAIVIGPAGENLVKYAVITHGSPKLGIGRGGQAARTGGGAVMGSKNLKGIVVVKSTPPPVADEGKLKEYVGETISNLVKSEKIKNLRKYGTSPMIDLGHELGFLPTYYWSKVTYEYIEKINAESLARILRSPVACMTCPAACGRGVKINIDGEVIEVEGPDYETMYSNGSLCGIKDIKHIVLVNEYADRLGLDTITFGNVYAFAVEACKAGKLELPYKIDYGDYRGMLKLLEDIAFARGDHGKLLGLGVKEVSERIGFEEAVHVKGLEPAGYDPRGLTGMYIAYATSPRGACHLRTMAYVIDVRGLAGPRHKLTHEKVKKIIEWEDWCSMFDSLVLCKFGRDYYSFEEMTKALNVVTGWNVDEEWVRAAGHRITTLVHYYNRGIHNLSREHDKIPGRLFKRTLDGKEPLSRSEFENALKTYYEMRGFNSDGTMNKDVLTKLGVKIGDIVL